MRSGSHVQEKSIQIREASLEDHNALADLSGELGYPTNRDDVRNRLEELLRSDEHGIFVAEEASGKVVGWIHVFSSPRIMVNTIADLGGLVVTETKRGHGVGWQLLKAGEEWASDKGLETVRVRSNVTRSRAHKFYESNGYEVLKSQVVFEKILA